MPWLGRLGLAPHPRVKGLETHSSCAKMALNQANCDTDLGFQDVSAFTRWDSQSAQGLGLVSACSWKGGSRGRSPGHGPVQLCEPLLHAIASCSPGKSPPKFLNPHTRGDAEAEKPGGAPLDRGQRWTGTRVPRSPRPWAASRITTASRNGKGPLGALWSPTGNCWANILELRIS